MRKNKGFSIIEMLVALALFATVALVALTSVISLVGANDKARTTRNALDNLSFAIEDMTRNLRFGKNYYCRPSGSEGVPISITISTPRLDCQGGGSYMAFMNKFGYIVLYRYDSVNKRILKKETSIKWGSADFTDNFNDGYEPITSLTDLEISLFKIYVIDDNPVTTAQRATIVIQGTAGVRVATKSSFNVMTSVFSRTVPVIREP